jgi:hypothetical protein
MATVSAVTLVTAPVEAHVYISLADGQAEAERQTFVMCQRSLAGWDRLQFSDIEVGVSAAKQHAPFSI